MALTAPSLPRKNVTVSPMILTPTGLRRPTRLALSAGYQYSRKPSTGTRSRISVGLRACERRGARSWLLLRSRIVDMADLRRGRLWPRGQRGRVEDLLQVERLCEEPVLLHERLRLLDRVLGDRLRPDLHRRVLEHLGLLLGVAGEDLDALGRAPALGHEVDALVVCAREAAQEGVVLGRPVRHRDVPRHLHVLLEVDGRRREQAALAAVE